MRQIHLNQCDSTQDVLKEQLMSVPSEEILISCEEQLNGRGRGENSWEAMPGTLCFSMSLDPHEVLSLTSLEIAVLIAKFFEQEGVSLKLKWPNDLLDAQLKKCGGILIQNNQKRMIVGVGINYFSQNGLLGSVYEKEQQINKEKEARKMAEFILGNRFSSSVSLKKEWNKRCAHLDRLVSIQEGEVINRGVFIGLGDYGEAIIVSDQEKKSFYNGSLRLII